MQLAATTSPPPPGSAFTLWHTQHNARGESKAHRQRVKHWQQEAQHQPRRWQKSGRYTECVAWAYQRIHRRQETTRRRAVLLIFERCKTTGQGGREPVVAGL